VTKIADLGVLRDVTTGAYRLEYWVEDQSGNILGRNSLSSTDFVAKKPAPAPAAAAPPKAKTKPRP